MTTLILLTSHLGGLDYDLDQTSKYSPKQNYKVLMSTAETGNLFGKIWIAQKQGLPIVNTLNRMGPAVGKNGLEIKAAITMPPRLKLLTLDHLTLDFLRVV
jgi:hypothetical protein